MTSIAGACGLARIAGAYGLALNAEPQATGYGFQNLQRIVKLPQAARLLSVRD